MSFKAGIFAIVLIVLGLVGSGSFATLEAQGKAKQSVRGGGVKVSVVLLEQTSDGTTFQVSMDTHSVNLDVYRFEEIVRLRDGQGGELAPKAVEAADGSGHHRKATLRFVQSEPEAKTMELVVKNVAGVSKRLFRWRVE